MPELGVYLAIVLGFIGVVIIVTVVVWWLMEWLDDNDDDDDDYDDDDYDDDDGYDDDDDDNDDYDDDDYPSVSGGGVPYALANATSDDTIVYSDMYLRATRPALYHDDWYEIQRRELSEWAAEQYRVIARKD
jgi:hypothetical protein